MTGSKDTPVPRGKLLPDALDLVAEIRGLIEETRATAAATVNAGLTVLSSRVGRRIHEEILKQGRAEYGQKILPTLSAKLLAEYGRGWSERKLAYMIRFAEVLPDSQILRELCARLGWSHIRQIIYIEDVLERDLYTEMCRAEGWSTRTLGKVSALMRQLSWTHFLFFHRDLRRLVAVELKLDKFRPAHLGQMELDLRWLDKYERKPGEEAPLDIILCAGKKQEQVELLELDSSGVHVAEYLPVLPAKELPKENLHASIELSRRHLEERSVKLEGRTGK